MPLASARAGLRGQAASGAPVTLRRSDTFNRTDSSSALGTPSDAGTGYTIINPGAFGISSNKAYMPAVSAGVSLAWLETGATTFDLTMTVARTGTTGYGYLIVSYYPSGGYGYGVRYNGSSSFDLCQFASNGTSIAATVTGTAFTGGSTSLRVTYTSTGGGVLKLYQGGALLGSNTIGTGNSGSTKIAFGATVAFATSGDTWDDLQAA
ncbi:MAG: hypothetical protein ACXV5Q_00640 [Frankiaceae bacterium]